MTVSDNKLRIPELVRKEGLPDILQEADLRYLVSGSDDRRYGIIKRALARGDLIQVRRGLYTLGELHRRRSIHTFELAQKIYGPSYVTAESALSYWGLIPEATYSCVCGSSGRAKEFQTPFGHFSYSRIPYQPLYAHVTRRKENDSVYFMATPIRALADYVYFSKQEWTWTAIQDSLRLEDPPLFAREELQSLITYFKNFRVQKFLKDLKKGLMR
jgi:hypothetical protein